MPKHALLIGIQRYRHLVDLDGPHNDVVDFGLLLMDQFGFPDDDQHVKAYFEGEITRQEIFEAFEDLCARVGRDDTVVIFYAGHGSQLVGPNGETVETLVPSDSGRPGDDGEGPENRDILDTEIDGWIARLNEKTPHVTLIFDSCHSGSVTRDALGPGVRQVPPDRLERRPDAVPRPLAARTGQTQSEPATRSLTSSVSRAAGSAMGRIFTHRSALVLAACRAEETAKERQVGTTPHGAFSYELIRALKKVPEGATWRGVFETAAARVAARYVSQHPQIEGNWDLRLFGTDEVRPKPYLPVREVDGDRVVLGGGGAHGATVGSVWSLHPPGALEPGDEAQVARAAHVTIESVAAGASVARRAEGARRGKRPKVGQRAFPVSVSVAGAFAASRLELLSMEPPLHSPLDDTVSMRVLRLGDETRAEVSESGPLSGDGMPRAAWGETVDVEVTSRHDAPVWISLLALESLGEVSTTRLLLPDRRHENYSPGGVRLKPGETLRLALDHHPGLLGSHEPPGLRWRPPAGLGDADEGVVQLRLMVTGESVDFSCLVDENTRDAGPRSEDEDLAWTFVQRSLLVGGGRLEGSEVSAGDGSEGPSRSGVEAALLRRKLRAVVVGINSYSSGIAPLQTAAADAEAVAEALRRQEYEVDLLLDGAADRAGLIAMLQGLSKKVDDDTALFVYFAGHGVALDDGTVKPRGYLLPADAKRLDESTWLPMDVVQGHFEDLEGAGCRHLLLVLDCCFAGSFRWTATRDAGMAGPLYESQLHRYLRGKAWHLLTSASHNERALDFPPGSGNPRDEPESTHGEAGASTRHSPFAAALLDGLAGAADTAFAGGEPDGVVTVSELYQYLYQRLVLQGGAAWQTPGLSPLRLDSTGEFIFVPPSETPPRPRPNPPPQRAENPWLGLKAYSSQDGNRFFGRKKEIAELCARIRRNRLVVVAGASGSGKSSLVRAGVVPALQMETPSWNVAGALRFHDGDPTATMNRAVESLDFQDETPDLLVVDQFEELFIKHPVSEQQRFLERLLELIEEHPLHVVLTIRSDFEPQLRAARGFAGRLSQVLYQIPPPGAESLREIIEEPARRCGFFFDGNEEDAEAGGKALPETLPETWFDGDSGSDVSSESEPETGSRSGMTTSGAEFVDRIMGEVLAMPGALPQLSFALSGMFREARKRWTAEDPDRSFRPRDFGGVVGSIHQRATKIYEAAPDEQKPMIRWMFLRMVSETGGRLARRRVEERELERACPEENELIRAGLEEYKSAGLIVSDEGFAEPGHDTLITAWPELLRWLRDAKADDPCSQDDLRDLWRSAVVWAESDEKRSVRRGRLWLEDPRLTKFIDPRGRLARFFLRRLGKHRRAKLAAERDARDAALAGLGRLEREFIDASAREFHSRRRWRWIRNVLLGIAGLIVLLVAVAGVAVILFILNAN